ncbi:hypothetical protein SKAU_G00413040 [Synaphobranchus kaupii]|uniref:Uncharacterized protein n=1 Tax=Synaphobranchus kaupii TaxID=118154 RepID=A0A9Q1E873_SYNKA|nr:hypothetical protein SKAU_G00413040 [Synaphobranchus kaupii]
MRCRGGGRLNRQHRAGDRNPKQARRPGDRYLEQARGAGDRKASFRDQVLRQPQAPESRKTAEPTTCPLRLALGKQRSQGNACPATIISPEIYQGFIDYTSETTVTTPTAHERRPLVHGFPLAPGQMRR